MYAVQYYFTLQTTLIEMSLGVRKQTGITWLDTGLCLRPGLFRSSSSCLRLKLETPRDLTSPASLQASKA